MLAPAGGVDRFQWRQGPGAWTGPLLMTVAVQNLANGIGVRFNAVVGHTVGNSWSVNVVNENCYLYLRTKNRGNGGPVFNPMQNLDAWIRIFAFDIINLFKL